MYTVGYTNPDGKGAKKIAGQPGWQPDGSYLTSEGDRLTDEVQKAGYLRTVQDWIISAQLKAVPGVAGVDSIGDRKRTRLNSRHSDAPRLPSVAFKQKHSSHLCVDVRPQYQKTQPSNS